MEILESVLQSISYLFHFMYTYSLYMPISLHCTAFLLHYSHLQLQQNTGKLNFVGRSGTTADIRYIAHNQGEMVEAYTNELVKHYAQHISDDAICKA